MQPPCVKEEVKNVLLLKGGLHRNYNHHHLDLHLDEIRADETCEAKGASSAKRK